MMNLTFSLLHRDDYVEPIPEEERGDIILAYHAQLTSADDEIRLRAARAWTKWEYALPLSLQAQKLTYTRLGW